MICEIHTNGSDNERMKQIRLHGFSTWQWNELKAGEVALQKFVSDDMVIALFFNPTLPAGPTLLAAFCARVAQADLTKAWPNCPMTVDGTNY